MRRRTTRACYGSISNGSRDDISVAGKCGRSLCEQNFAARTGDAGYVLGDRPAHLQARRLSPARRRQGKPAGKKSPATANFLFDAQSNLFGIARQIKKSANFVHGLFAYRLAERRGFEPLKPFRGLLAFQAGQFNHSCIFPKGAPKVRNISRFCKLRPFFSVAGLFAGVFGVGAVDCRSGVGAARISRCGFYGWGSFSPCHVRRRAVPRRFLPVSTRRSACGRGGDRTRCAGRRAVRGPLR